MGFPEVFGCIVAAFVFVIKPAILLLLLNCLLNLPILFLRLARCDKCTVFVILRLGDHETRSWVFIHSFSLNSFHVLLLGTWLLLRHKFKIILNNSDLSLLGWNVVVVDFNLVIQWVSLHDCFILTFSNIQLKSLINVLNVCYIFQEVVHKVLVLLAGGIDHIQSLSWASVNMIRHSLRLYFHTSCTLLR